MEIPAKGAVLTISVTEKDINTRAGRYCMVERAITRKFKNPYTVMWGYDGGSVRLEEGSPRFYLDVVKPKNDDIAKKVTTWDRWKNSNKPEPPDIKPFRFKVEVTDIINE